MSRNITGEIFNKLPFLPGVTGDKAVAPTTGTKVLNKLFCGDKLSDLQTLSERALKAYETFNNSINKLKSDNLLLEKVTPAIYGFNSNKINAADWLGLKLFRELTEVCMASKPEKIKTSANPFLSTTYGIAAPALLEFIKEILAIEKLAAQIKKEAETLKNKVVITDTITSKPKLETILAIKYLYDIKLYLITPGGLNIPITQYIQSMLYTKVFDGAALPIYSIMFGFPQTIMQQIKRHNENIKWFMSITAREKTAEQNNNVFKIGQELLKNHQMIPVDPVFNPPQADSENNATGLPTYKFKIDLLPHKDTTLNAKTKARVFKNVKLLDVISVLAAELKAEYAKRKEDSSKEVKFSISPPDNSTVYEQIIVEPGSFTKVLEQLQSKYGIYYTGIRVSFDSIQTKRDGKSSSSFTQVTILGKGDKAPTKDSYKDVLVELIDPRSIKDPAYDTGMAMDSETGTIRIRSFIPYLVTRKNSESLVNGESIRVMNSSPDDHNISNCDNDETDVGMQKLFWSNYNNPYALTQLQDSIREKSITVQGQFQDLNPLLFNDNLNYDLKFYGEDADIYSGKYRLKELRWWFKNGNTVNSYNLNEIMTSMVFSYAPDLRVNGSEVPKETYSEKLSKSSTGVTKGYVEKPIPSTTNAYVEKPIPNTTNNKGTSTNTTGSANTNIPLEYGMRAPFYSNFMGKKDFYNVEIPEKIPATWRMSDKTTLKDVYDTSFGNNPNLGDRLCNSYMHFIYAQRFAKEVLDPCITLLGSKGTGDKFAHWYKYDIASPNAHTSMHLIALAVDSNFGGSNSNAIADKFFKLFKSSIEYDQIILLGNGSEWESIHVSKQLNGTNRKEIKVSLTNTANDVKIVNTTKLKSATDLYYSVVLKVCY